MLKIAHNATVAQLLDADPDAKLEVHRLLSYAVDGGEMSDAFRCGAWNGRSSFFNYDNGVFPTGFVRLVAQGLKKFGRQVQIVAKPRPEPLGPELPVVDEFGYQERYDYQPKAVETLIRHGNVTAQVATGGGKSRIARMAFKRIDRMTLFLTTRSILLDQMKEAVEKMTGEPVAVLGDGEWGIVGADGKRRLSKFTCGMVQTLAQRIQGENNAVAHEILSRFEFVIAEEAHEVSGAGFYNVMRACTNAHYRLALTATPFMKDSEESNMQLLASCGPIGIQITEKLLIDRGILARPYFKFIRLEEVNKPKRLYKSTPYQAAYHHGIVENLDRNKRLVAEVLRGKRYGLNAMVLVQHKAHGEILKRMFELAGASAAFIFGDHSKRERQAALKGLGDGSLDVLIGSTILDVGVDVPSVGMIVLAGGGKAEYQLKQRIGRGLREKKNGFPNVALIVDVADDFNTHLRSHAMQRRAIIEQTPGFNEGIVRDFDYVGLGLTRKAA